ncbi:MAG: UDP-N-acetylmuramoyl-L-alanyl-D-glutamate--2,6-diaminopimelate ligase [Candidatus Tectomicrobia bacterium]|uniref:UDP-N-acetylmuramoyl-L-alanyl-D-glutamate--2,6-diaminopimelate ligase n=1 Tax=Tectimicrobiota bacterium TaxID=2528274 RepID=A0A932M0C5_UNCTE|nr:UDP-N-acetylmuramoyl-L-alanyl-D-glutamate--2,6-diaminopimelate ligase [Candidatus Tectomicrobia bacterium]
MRLTDLLAGLDGCHVEGSLQCEIPLVTDDSRQVIPGSLFVALKGTRADGRAYVREALARGAAAVVLENQKEQGSMPVLPGSVTRILVPNSHRALGHVADAFWHHPSRRVKLIGITGTNGKTTTAFLVESILKTYGKRTGMIGTVRWGFDSNWQPAPQTTPGAVEIQSRLDEMAKGGVEFCVMEVSSHALAQDRVWGCRFEVAIFTNLSQDHLDFHHTMESYFDAKALLFTEYPIGGAVINRDDPWGGKLLGMCRAPRLSYSAEEAGDLVVRDPRLSMEGLSGVLCTPCGEHPVSARLLGKHNRMNILAAAGACHFLGLDLPTIARGIADLDGVPGRFEKVDEGQDFGVMVDYAHTDDALRNLLTTARELNPRRLVVLFGCGGDRDKGKRPLMGDVAARLADFVVLTSDNPRSEDPEVILGEIEVGVERAPVRVPYLRIPDRREAIARAISEASAGDLVVIAGKGHETEQIVGSRRYPFDDRQVAREFLRRRLGTGAGLKRQGKQGDD